MGAAEGLMIVILLGPPGVGKGTQAAIAAEAHGWLHLSTGDLLRAQVAQKTDIGLQADRYMSKGDLVPDVLMVEMVAQHLTDVSSEVVVLLDGFPRTIAQAEALSEKAPGGSIALSLYFRASNSELSSRLTGRGRADDTEEVVAHRLKVYHETTSPLISWYQEKGILVEIDANRDIASIQTDFAHAVDSTLKGFSQITG